MGDIIHLTVYSLLSSDFKIKMDSIYTAQSLEKIKFGKAIISDKVIKFYMGSRKMTRENYRMNSIHLKSFYSLFNSPDCSRIFDYISKAYGKGFVITNDQYDYINPEKCLDIVYDFLKVCSPMLGKIFVKAYQDGRILFTDKDKHVNYKMGNVKKNYIVLEKLCSYHDICILVHELGHMYADCFCEYDYNDTKSVLVSECFSMYLEYYFNQYCIYNNMFNKEASKHLKGFYNCTIKCVYDSMRNNISEMDLEYSLKYALGGLIATDTYKKYGDCSIEEIYKYFSKNDLMYIIDDFSKGKRRK